MVIAIMNMPDIYAVERINPNSTEVDLKLTNTATNSSFNVRLKNTTPELIKPAIMSVQEKDGNIKYDERIYYNYPFNVLLNSGCIDEFIELCALDGREIKFPNEIPNMLQQIYHFERINEDGILG